MGEIADEIIEGSRCEICGAYYVDEDDQPFSHGYPAVCHLCWLDMPSKYRIKHQEQNPNVKTL